MMEHGERQESRCRKLGMLDGDGKHFDKEDR